MPAPARALAQDVVTSDRVVRNVVGRLAPFTRSPAIGRLVLTIADGMITGGLD